MKRTKSHFGNDFMSSLHIMLIFTMYVMYLHFCIIYSLHLTAAYRVTSIALYAPDLHKCVCGSTSLHTFQTKQPHTKTFSKKTMMCTHSSKHMTELIRDEWSCIRTLRLMHQ